jgi:hypothetical protein
MGKLTNLFVVYRTVELNIKAKSNCTGKVVMTVVVMKYEGRSMELNRGIHVSNMFYACHNVIAWYIRILKLLYMNGIFLSY